MRKNATDAQRVATPVRQRQAASRKRALRSRTVRAARSVCSEHRSRVTESRKFVDRWGLPVCVRGDSIDLPVKALSKSARPGSTSRAEVYGGIPGTWEGLCLPVENECRIGARPAEQGPGSQRMSPPLRVSNQRGPVGYRRSSSRQERRERRSGRLSALIVAFESRETPPGRSL